MINNTEIEFKYDAEKIGRDKFDTIIKGFGPTIKSLTLTVTSPDGLDSIDHYFSNGSRFMRWRESHNADGVKTWELTSKSRTNKLNNNIRKETNLPLIVKDMDFEKAKDFSEQHKLRYDFSIGKDVQVYWFETIVLSHYTTYNIKGKSVDTFMEIEANEEYPWENEAKALTEVIEWEKKFAPLGITPQHRIKKSLFEFYTNFK